MGVSKDDIIRMYEINSQRNLETYHSNIEKITQLEYSLSASRSLVEKVKEAIAMTGSGSLQGGEQDLEHLIPRLIGKLVDYVDVPCRDVIKLFDDMGVDVVVRKPRSGEMPKKWEKKVKLLHCNEFVAFKNQIPKELRFSCVDIDIENLIKPSGYRQYG